MNVKNRGKMCVSSHRNCLNLEVNFCKIPLWEKLCSNIRGLDFVEMLARKRQGII